MLSESGLFNLTKNMNKPTSFDCHSFLDNHTFAIVEISTKHSSLNNSAKSYHWLLVHKIHLTVRELQITSTDDSNSVQERYFDMGYMKFDARTGVFISQESNQPHPLCNLSCKDIPVILLQAVESYLQTA